MLFERRSGARSRLLYLFRVSGKCFEYADKALNIPTIHLPAAIITCNNPAGGRGAWTDEQNRQTGGEQGIDLAWDQ